MKCLILILLALIILTNISGCAKKFDYPDGFTNKYCYENYSPMGNNYIYASSYSNHAPGYLQDGAWRRYFSAIPYVDINTFLACEEIIGLGGKMASYYAILYQSNDSDIDPLNDWEIDNIEICLLKGDVCLSTDDSYIVSYGDSIYHASISKISDDILIKQIVDCINNQEKYINYYDKEFSRFGEYVKFNEENKSYYYSIRIHFNETDMILWAANIIMNNNHYYLKYCQKPYDYEYCIPLTAELEEFISSSIDTQD